MVLLLRVLLGLGFLALLGYGALYALATFVEPEPREISTTIPMPRPKSGG